MSLLRLNHPPVTILIVMMMMETKDRQEEVRVRPVRGTWVPLPPPRQARALPRLQVSQALVRQREGLNLWPVLQSFLCQRALALQPLGLLFFWAIIRMENRNGEFQREDIRIVSR